MNEIKTVFNFAFRMTKSQAAAMLSACLLFSIAAELGSETYKMLTYYPAPYGSYKKFVTTGDTWLAKSGGTVLIGKSSKTSTDGGTKLETDGAIVIGTTDKGSQGALRVTATAFEAFYNNQWNPLTTKADLDKAITSVTNNITNNPAKPSASFTTRQYTVSGPSNKTSGSFSPLAKVVDCSTKYTYTCKQTWMTYSPSCCDAWACKGQPYGAKGGPQVRAVSETTTRPTCTASISGNTITVTYSPLCTLPPTKGAGPCGGDTWDPTAEITQNSDYSAIVSVYDSVAQ